MYKLLLLPIIGLITLIFFTWSAFSLDAVFFNKLLVCAFILVLVFIGRLRASK